MKMKRRLISTLLSVIMTFSVAQPVFSVDDDSLFDALFSSTPVDMTPAEQDYSPGLGDRMDGISYTLTFGSLAEGFPATLTYEEALAIQEKVANLTNGGHQISYTIAQDVLRWGTAPYLIEDTAYPLGDGTPGSGYAKYNQYVEDSFKNNADVAQILEPLLAGSLRDDYASEEEKIPQSCYTHDENGEKKVGWSAQGRDWYLLSLYNLYDSGYAQTAWQRMQDTWNFRSHIYYDAMIPVPEGLYNNPNLTTEYGGKITNTQMEWDAVQTEIRYSWENYAISSGQEYIHPKYKGLSCSFSVPYGLVTDNDYLNTWQNSVVIGKRGDSIQNLVWGCELGEWDYSLGESNSQWSTFTRRLMEYNLQYLYMLERRPLSYTNNKDVYEVIFSGDLVSSYDRKTDNYTLIENGDFVIADGGDRFIPQVGAGCKIYAYSRDGKTRTWKLPETWAEIREANLYRLSVDSEPVKLNTLAVENGSVTLDMAAGVPYLLVPKGDSPTPDTANFNELSGGDTVSTYQNLSLDVSGNPEIKVYDANARGGFSTPGIYADSSETCEFLQIGMDDGAILHSLKVANKGGSGRVVLHSSNPLNPDVMIELPETDQVYKFNTGWVYGETGEVTVKIENDESASNVLFDAVMYSETSRVKSCADGEHEYVRVHVDAICGTDGRDSDICRFCGDEINATVLPKIDGEHSFTDNEVILTATPHNSGSIARFCLKCSYKTEQEIKKLFNPGNHVYHHDYGNNYMHLDDLLPYANSCGTAVFDVIPLDVTERSSGPCYIGVWFGAGYSICAAYDFAKQEFVIGEGGMQYGTSIEEPLATKSYSWTRMSNGNYPLHRFAFTLVGNTATIYLDGIEMLSCTDPSLASANDIMLMYTKGEFIIDNIAVSDSEYDIETGIGDTISRVDFEKGDKSLAGWILGGYTGTDIREFDMSAYIPEDHIHSNSLISSHEATYHHGPYNEYECSSCHERTVVETGDALSRDKLVHMSALEPTCTEDGHREYWYDQKGNRFSDKDGKTAVTLSAVTVTAAGHDLVYNPPVKAATAEDSFVEYWTCSKCKKNFADSTGETELSIIKTKAVRETEQAIASISKVTYMQETKVDGKGVVGTFNVFDGNSCYSVLDVGNPNCKLNADYTVEMLVRFKDVDTTTEIGGVPGAFFGLSCENLTVGYDFASEKWGISPISGLFASYPFNPTQTGPMSVLDDGYFHNIRFECTTEAVRVYVDGTCVLNSTDLVRENNRFCLFYPRLCTVEFASYAFMYNGKWVDDHLTGHDIVTASTWTSRGAAFGTAVQSFSGSTFVDSLKAIENAESMYDKLSANEKLLVSNYVTLVSKRNEYERLADGIILGDVTGDGKINLTDVSMILKYIAKWDIKINTELADVNCDGKINLTDVSMILKYIAKWDITFGS